MRALSLSDSEIGIAGAGGETPAERTTEREAAVRSSESESPTNTETDDQLPRRRALCFPAARNRCCRPSHCALLDSR